MFGPGAYLAGAHLQFADLDGPDLTGANLIDVSSGGITGTPASLPTDWQLIDGYLIGPDAYLANADLQNADLDGADLTGAIFTDVSSGGITGTPASLPTDWQLIDGYLIGPGANLSGADLSGADLSNADLSGMNFSDADLTGVNFFGTDLSGGNFSGADLSGESFSVDDLSGGNFSGADLSGVTFSNVALTGVDFSGADFSGTSFSYINSNDPLFDVASGGIVGTPAVLPSNWVLAGGYLVGPGADLQDANLSGVDLSSANLGNGSDGVISGGVTGIPIALPRGWSLANGYLVGPGVDLNPTWCSPSGEGPSCGFYVGGVNLSGADLTGMNFSNADLTGVNFSGADLTGATFSNAVLNRVNFSGATLTGADLTESDSSMIGVVSGDVVGMPSVLPSDWILAGGYLVGPYADLQDANLDGVDLSSATLATFYTYIEGLVPPVQMTISNGSVISGGITGTPSALPPGWELVNGYLLGPGVDLNAQWCTTTSVSSAPSCGFYAGGANLTGANISGMDLSGADLTNANLANANLANANLTDSGLSSVNFGNADLSGANLTNAFMVDANVTGADLASVVWSNTTCPGNTNSNTYSPYTCVGH
jgi:uncharacterized protein YjbI with pentapeptide repeats